VLPAGHVARAGRVRGARPPAPLAADMIGLNEAEPLRQTAGSGESRRAGRQAGARAPLLHTAWAACRAEVHVAHEVLHRWHLACRCVRTRARAADLCMGLPLRCAPR